MFHDWYNKDRGMCYLVCGIVYIKEPPTRSGLEGRVRGNKWRRGGRNITLNAGYMPGVFLHWWIVFVSRRVRVCFLCGFLNILVCYCFFVLFFNYYY